jgi:hypothetical protein
MILSSAAAQYSWPVLTGSNTNPNNGTAAVGFFKYEVGDSATLLTTMAPPPLGASSALIQFYKKTGEEYADDANIAMFRLDGSLALPNWDNEADGFHMGHADFVILQSKTEIDQFSACCTEEDGETLVLIQYYYAK